MNQCDKCGQPAELHHIVFKSTAKYMQNVPINFKYLCPEHHRLGKDAPHLNRKSDIEYKLEMQKKLFEMFSAKEYFQFGEIQNILQISGGEVNGLIKVLKLYKEGYKAFDIVVRCMGNRLYAE